ncbi:hypothetical protein F2P56_004283 [Juglans regia]|uniref:Uncharacterized protein n=1 Tax=Juglans regia TaxID=51240 RepID=A0A833Y7Z5_JUGRE|nr:hypothetical protein F2P56_004283 [Juglans regia]
MEKVNYGECSIRQEQKHVWEGLWRLNVPNSTKQFVWRALNNILPTKKSLAQKNVVKVATCQACGMEEETVCHVLWTYPAASDVWAESQSGLQKWTCEEKEFFYIWAEMQSKLQKTKVEEVAMILKGLWFRRNRMVFEGKFDSPSKVIAAAISGLKCFQESRLEGNQTKGVNIQRRKDTKWKPPDEGVTKVNFDAAIDKPNNKVGLGIVGRNYEGELLFSLCASKMFSGSSDLAEAITLWRAMDLVVEPDGRNVVFEGDAERVIKGVAGKGIICASMTQLFDDMRSRLVHRQDWSVEFIYRKGNSVAHELAKRALRMEGACCWIEEGPIEIVDIVKREMLCNNLQQHLVGDRV